MAMPQYSSCDINYFYVMSKTSEYMFFVCTPGNIFSKIAVYKYNDNDGRYRLIGFPIRKNYYWKYLAINNKKFAEEMGNWNQEQWESFHVMEALSGD
jgi:hypothetical protein